MKKQILLSFVLAIILISGKVYSQKNNSPTPQNVFEIVSTSQQENEFKIVSVLSNNNDAPPLKAVKLKTPYKFGFKSERFVALLKFYNAAEMRATLTLPNRTMVTGSSEIFIISKDEKGCAFTRIK